MECVGALWPDALVDPYPGHRVGGVDAAQSDLRGIASGCNRQELQLIRRCLCVLDGGDCDVQRVRRPDQVLELEALTHAQHRQSFLDDDQEHAGVFSSGFKFWSDDMQGKAWVSFWFTNLLFTGLGVTKLTRDEVGFVIVFALAGFAFSAWIFMHGFLTELCKAKQPEPQPKALSGEE